MVPILIGFYIGIAFSTFLATLFLVCCGANGIGGKNEDLWKPFVYAALWPVFIPLIIMGIV